MSYKIAVASSDEQAVDLHFGAAEHFFIYEVTGTSYRLAERRTVIGHDISKEYGFNNDCSVRKACDKNSACDKGGCNGGFETVRNKVETIGDCRCIVCKKIGFQVQKQLERRAIASFDVECSLKEALQRIVSYYDHIDRHVSLRNLKEEEHEKSSKADN